MFVKKGFVTIYAVLFVFLLSATGFSGDWPMWRYDAQRTNVTCEQLPAELHLQWTRQYLPLETAWQDPINQDRMSFDKIYEPVVMGSTMFIGFNSSDKLVALDTKTGAEKWRFYADGPIRFAPAAYKGKVYFVSDDGYLYCVDAKIGKQLWKFRGGPRDRWILGNNRLISMWPARGGPVIVDGKVYFTAGIWPFMGVFVYCLEAESGKVIWSNSGTGSMYHQQPHGSANGFGGVGVQGHLVAIDDKLLAPGGRSVPACFDRNSGELLYYELAKTQKMGGSHVSAMGKYFFNFQGSNKTGIYDLETGERILGRIGEVPVLTDDVYYFSGKTITAYDVGSIKEVEYEVEEKNRKTGEMEKVTKIRWSIDKLWNYEVDGSGCLIKAGGRLYAGGDGVVSALEIGVDKTKVPKVVWSAKIEGNAERIIAADNKLFVVTQQGTIYAFGKKKAKAKNHPLKTIESTVDKAATERAQFILTDSGISEGYCLAYGLKDGALIEALAKNSKLKIIGFDSDKELIEKLRRRFDDAGLYGGRIAVCVAEPLEVEVAPYLASLIVSEDVGDIGSGKWELFEKTIFSSLRPYGGAAYLPTGKKFTVYKREGALAGSADWTGLYADASNTVVSKDKLVKAPLGLLWFGSSSHEPILPRHGHGPSPQVSGGRLFIEGADIIRAADVYTGRVLWERSLPGIGDYYNNTRHHPGANAIGTNYVCVEDGIYVAYGRKCLKLDVETGETICEFELARTANEKEPPIWGYIGVYKDILIAGAEVMMFPEEFRKEREGRLTGNFDKVLSKRIVAMNRHTGKELWSFTADLGLRHNSIAIGGDKVFCIDMLPAIITEALERRGEKPTQTPRLRALDIRTGEVIWTADENIFGTWLSYSEKYDILLEAGKMSGDMLFGEPRQKMATYRGKDGKLVWSKRHRNRYYGPCMLHGDMIITSGYRGTGYSLLTGERKKVKHPLSDEDIYWGFTRNYGCGSAVASEYLITMRSGGAGFYDLISNSGTGNLGGFKSSCTSNLIVANGLLNAPDYTRTCICSYQNQTSLALIHMPEVEIWTFNNVPPPKQPVKRVGLNFGAPGDRKADNGTMWLEYPIESKRSVGGDSLNIPVSIEPQNVRKLRRHSSVIESRQLKWVAASAIIGASEINVTLAKDAEKARFYTVRLFFAEIEDVKKGERVFSVKLGDKEVLKQFDVVRSAGGVNRCVAKVFKNIEVTDTLKISLTACANSKEPPLLNGVEIICEGP